MRIKFFTFLILISMALPAMANVGSNGTDASANIPALPNIGANFAASGPYASYVLVRTIGANSARNYVEINNTSGGQIVVIRDDGTAAVGAAPINGTIFALAAGAGTAQQGAGWSSQTFRGRLQIYAPTALTGNAYVAAFQD